MRIAVRAGSWLSSCVLASLAANPAVTHAQGTGARTAVTPVAPSSAIGTVTNLSTVSLMGTTALPSNDDKGAPTRQQLYMGLSQPIGRLGEVKFTAIGSGYWQMKDRVGATSSAEGALALRATGRVNGMRAWGAVSYGRAGAMGGLSSFGGAASNAPIGYEGARVDTTVSRRVDVGAVARIESGMLGTHHGFDMSLGMSLERATRVTTQTMIIQAENTLPLPNKPEATVKTLRGVQRREIATGLASVGWRTGRTSWLSSVSAPIYSWISKDATTPNARAVPAVVSLAVAQPLNAWLSAIGSASTNPTSVGYTSISDDATARRRGNMSPVFALGVSVARVPFRNRHGEATLNGILGFESRVVEALDSVIILSDSTRINGDSTYRVQLVIDAPAAGYVELMGDATAWTVTNMSRGGDGRWRAELKLSVGAHRLAVRADGGEWIAPPGLPLGSNDFGNPVGLLVMQPRKQPN